MSYLVGLTDMKLSHWIFISAIGRIPAIFLSVLSGNALNESDYVKVAVMFAVMIVLSIFGVVFYNIKNKKESDTDSTNN